MSKKKQAEEMALDHEVYRQASWENDNFDPDQPLAQWEQDILDGLYPDE